MVVREEIAGHGLIGYQVDEHGIPAGEIDDALFCALADKYRCWLYERPTWENRDGSRTRAATWPMWGPDGQNKERLARVGIIWKRAIAGGVWGVIRVEEREFRAIPKNWYSGKGSLQASDVIHG